MFFIFISIVLTTISVFISFKIISFSVKLDCDLKLYYYSKFGKSAETLKEKIIWVNGASSGIGANLAYRFANIGSKLILSSNEPNQLEKVKHKCLNINSTLKDEDIFIVSFDIKHISKHEKHFKEVLRHFNGKIDILINNVGKSQRASFEEIDLAVDKELFDINVFGSLNLTRILIRHWYATKSNGHIVVTSSMSGIFGSPYSSSYTASKHALKGYYEALRLESFKKGIDVTIVCPGPVATNLMKSAFAAKLGQTLNITVDDKDEKEEEVNTKMSVDRCGQLMVVAIANKLDEVWICKQPFLIFLHFNHFFPSLNRFILKHFFDQNSYTKFRDPN